MKLRLIAAGLALAACAPGDDAADATSTYLAGDLGDWAAGAGLDGAIAPFGLDHGDLVLRARSTDARGGHHLRYRQVHAGLPVIGGDLVVHLDAAERIVAINGTARGDLPARDSAPDGSVYLIDGDGRAFLADERDQRYVDDDGIEQRDLVYLDRATGAVVATYPQVHTALNRRVYSALNRTSPLPGLHKRSEGQPASTDVDVNAAYDNTGHFYASHLAFFNRDSYDNAGANIVSSVHYGRNFCNALWNGTQMIFGDGGGACHPLARSIDVTGHELTHAVTKTESQLVYSGESGGLNESLSNVFGAFVEAWADGGGTGELAISDDTWIIGEDVLDAGIRDLCDPASDGRSADFWSSTVKNLNVHYSSGIGDLAFCLLARGGSHPRGKSAIVVPAIGFETALRVLYKAQTDILTSNTTYAGARLAAQQAAAQLGLDQATIDAVGCAWAAVNVGTAPASCAP